jgi:hypothetical protein
LIFLCVLRVLGGERLGLLARARVVKFGSGCGSGGSSSRYAYQLTRLYSAERDQDCRRQRTQFLQAVGVCDDDHHRDTRGADVLLKLKFWSTVTNPGEEGSDRSGLVVNC